MEATGWSSFLIDFALAFLTVLGTLALLWGWFTWLSTRATRDIDGGPDPAAVRPVGSGTFTGPGTWGEPDLDPPSTSESARAETAELEALWELPPRRADSGHA
jgi:hypothetical protein